MEIDSSYPDGGASPDERYVAREQRALLRSIIAEMRGACRELFCLVAVDELTYREIAELQGRTPAAVRTQMSQCLKEARRALRLHPAVRRPARTAIDQG